jgi:hypothetical protein
MTEHRIETQKGMGGRADCLLPPERLKKTAAK